MKKSLLAIVLSVALLACAFLPAYAVEEKIPYGKAEVTLTLADSLENLTFGQVTFGQFACKDGTLVVTSSDAADSYDVNLAESPDNQAAYTGKQYVVLDVVNNSDGNIWFCMMPSVAGSQHLFLRPNDPTPTVLIDSRGGMQKAEWTDEPNLSFRYGFLIPEAFEGYICIPFSSFCEINQWDTPYLTEAKPLTQMGIHIEQDLGSHIELVVNDLYTTGALPEYKEDTTVTPGYLADFTTQETYNKAGISERNFCSTQWDELNKALKFQAVSTTEVGGARPFDMDSYFRFTDIDGKLNCTENRYMVMRLKNSTHNTSIYRMLFTTDQRGDLAANECKLPIDSGMTGFKTYVFDMTQFTGNWVGTLNHIRMDSVRYPFESAVRINLGSEYYLQWMAFFGSEEDARNYKGPAGTDPSANEQDGNINPAPADNVTEYAHLTFKADDPWYWITTPVDTTKAKYGVVRYRLPEGAASKEGQFFSSAPANPNENLTYTADGAWHIAYIRTDSSVIPGWNGTMDRFRFDPLQGNVQAGDTIDIAWIAFTETEPAEDFDGTGAAIFVGARAIALGAATEDGQRAIDSSVITAEAKPASPEDTHNCKDHLTKVEKKDPTCTENGNIEYYKCECGKLYKDANAEQAIEEKDTVVAATGHKYGDNGVCSVCGAKDPNKQTGDVTLAGLAVILTVALGAVCVMRKKQRA